MSKSEIEAKIEFQEEIGEANPGGYQPVKFSRVKYKASPTAHIDIRRYQRGYDDEGEEAFFPTKVGFRFPERKKNKWGQNTVSSNISKNCVLTPNNSPLRSALYKTAG